jgi:hypothetical protein
MGRAVVLLVVVVARALAAGAAQARIPRPFQKCAQLNARYPHGVGRANARDLVKGTTEPRHRRRFTVP